MSSWLLPLLLAVPAVGALALLVLPGPAAERLAVRLGVVVSAATLAVSVWATAASPETDVEWVPELG
jgi:hypothetical protein